MIVCKRTECIYKFVCPKPPHQSPDFNGSSSTELIDSNPTSTTTLSPEYTYPSHPSSPQPPLRQIRTRPLTTADLNSRSLRHTHITRITSKHSRTRTIILAQIEVDSSSKLVRSSRSACQGSLIAERVTGYRTSIRFKSASSLGSRGATLREQDVQIVNFYNDAVALRQRCIAIVWIRLASQFIAFTTVWTGSSAWADTEEILRGCGIEAWGAVETACGCVGIAVTGAKCVAGTVSIVIISTHLSSNSE